MTEPELRRAILQNPDDDAPRLAYADWCDAHAHPARAAYIRAQLARAKHDPWSPEADRFFQEEMHALHARPKSEKWSQPANELLERYRIRTKKPRTSLSFDDTRGFISGVGGDAAEVAAILPELATLEPITHLWLEYPGRSGATPSTLPHLAALPALSRITRLGLNASPDLLRVLAASPHLANITRLFLYSNPPENRTLDLNALLPALLDALRTMTATTHLELRGIPLGPAGLQQLTAHLLPRGQWHTLALDQAALTDTGAALLAATPGLTDLRILSLRDNQLTPAAVTALANTPTLPALESLDLSLNPIDPPGLHALATRTALPRLTRLGIADAIREEVEEQWTDWNGANLGSSKTLRPLDLPTAATRYPLAGITYYAHP